MVQEDINYDEWEAFCETFGREHQNWLVNVEVLTLNGTKDIVEHSALLKGIAIQEDKEGPRVLISYSKTSDERRVHEVQSPTVVRAEKNDRGAYETLRIESDTGDTTVISLHSPSAERYEGLDTIGPV